MSRLASSPSETVSSNSYTPAAAGVNVACAVAAPVSETVTPSGAVIVRHANVSGSPSGSEDAPPWSVTSVPTVPF